MPLKILLVGGTGSGIRGLTHGNNHRKRGPVTRDRLSDNQHSNTIRLLLFLYSYFMTPLIPTMLVLRSLLFNMMFLGKEMVLPLIFAKHFVLKALDSKTHI